MTSVPNPPRTPEVPSPAPPSPEAAAPNPWRGLVALCIGFFMILVDSTIVTVATPAIMTGLGADISAVVWVTSAYLLAFAVPLLITGRLGDRFGPKNLYLSGLVVFTAASLWCGLSGDVTQLIIARVVQGLGAAMISPQSMAVITRTFPATSRGQAMGVWGAVAGLATLVGPILGGVLVDGLGWPWIFFVNVPIGVVALILAVRWVPALEHHGQSFDWLGVVLSAAGMFCVVFAIEEGHSYDWGTIVGPVSVPLLLVLGAVVLAGFVFWQSRNTTNPLVPLSLFGDRNFSLACVAMTTVGVAITSMTFPIMLWAQGVRGFTPTQAALLLAPQAVVSAVLAPFVGRLVNRVHPRLLAGFGLSCFIASLVWLLAIISPTVPVIQILAPMTLLGLANGFMWAPISTTATGNLAPERAGAGSGVYNTVRQVGSVLGSAGIAVLMESRLSTRLGPGAESMTDTASGGGMPAQIADGFSAAMADSLWLPALVLLIGVAAVLCFQRPAHLAVRAATGPRSKVGEPAR